MRVSIYCLYKSAYPSSHSPNLLSRNTRMANNEKQAASSPENLLDDFFGIKQHPDSASVLALLSSKPKDSDTANSAPTRRMPMCLGGSQAWNRNQGSFPQDSGANKENKLTFPQESVHPSPLSSSIYYGSLEDMYVQSSSSQASKSYPTYYKYENGYRREGRSVEDEGAATIKWWEGSVYY
ncbi:uncharacterized protein LOC108206394 [Daucus carota subsp. sativus]|uniref:uncharacterized protein LOC108206394 n=1 Tax=Daucus carota subsp. sativus TaxID=79200 RepID=UPI0007EFAA14|nr:PREDICTED: uncharacterized protein LOC108206394 [Daucus carota subsp. sativus]